jgi:TetR/AcrR family transcriptional regulator, transcriptional repressor for nem operon
MTDILLLVKEPSGAGGSTVGTSQAAKAASHDRILDVAAARIRRDGIDKLTVAELMNEAGLTNGGFYRHFDSREQLVVEATKRAMTDGSAWSVESGQLGGRRGYAKLVNGYLSMEHRDHPESGCGVAAMAADVARTDGAARVAYTHQVEQCLSVLSGLVEHSDPQRAEREAVVLLSTLVGAISIARAVDDPQLSNQILTHAITALKERIST